MFRLVLHYSIHFLVPIAIGLIFFKEKWKWAIFILLAGICIDLDHLFADPIFDPNRCSIGYHPLHTYWAMAVYIALLFFRKTRIFGLALVIHIVADAVDCYLLLQSK